MEHLTLETKCAARTPRSNDAWDNIVHCTGEIWKRSFSSIVRPTVLTYPSRKRSFSSNRFYGRHLETGHLNIIKDFIWIRERLFNSILQSPHYHYHIPSHPMSYPLYIKQTGRPRSLKTRLVWNSNIVIVLNIVLEVPSIGLSCSLYSLVPLVIFSSEALIHWLSESLENAITFFSSL